MFENNEEVHSLTQAAVVLIVYVFLVLILYFVLSVPINLIFNGFEGADWGAAEPYKTDHMATIRQTATIFFAIFISIPLVWFFFWVFHREPRYGPPMDNQWR